MIVFEFLFRATFGAAALIPVTYREAADDSTEMGKPMPHRDERFDQDFLSSQMLFDGSPFIQVRSQNLFANATVKRVPSFRSDPIVLVQVRLVMIDH